MKKILLSLLILSFFGAANAQTAEDEVKQTCYQRYAKVFEKRGAFEVEDGTYDDVIITFRKGSMAECFYGKVSVKNGEILTHDMHLKFEDNTYEEIIRNFKYKEQPVTISGGMSRTMVTVDEELINVLFVKKIRPKKKSYYKAPDPDFDL